MSTRFHLPTASIRWIVILVLGFAWVRTSAAVSNDVSVGGTSAVWHKLTLTLPGPQAAETDTSPNPFLDYRLTVTFRHADSTIYEIPGFFAADGDAAESSATTGNRWRVHFTPDRPGTWTYEVELVAGKDIAVELDDPGRPVEGVDGQSGTIEIEPSSRRDGFRHHGRLQYVGERYLRHAATGKRFLKAGADAPETLLGYADFDGTVAGKPNRVPLKTWQPHKRDWASGDPTWQDGKGKGLIGAINYLSGKGCNAFSFLTYNAGGDGDNVWPFIDRDDKLHYDCSKLDQWGIVFDHGTDRNMYLHFKLQETEMDDNRVGHKRRLEVVKTSLDGGDLGIERKLYCRELIARFGHNLALNWNLGEENTQSTEQLNDIINYIDRLDAYDHPIVLHTFPSQQDQQYRPLLGDQSKLTGLSLQNSAIRDTHWQTVKWVRESAKAGKPWIVAFDESGSAAHGQCPDLGYRGFDGTDAEGKTVYTRHEVRRQTLWGHLMGGGAGVEYYFGYRFVENDLVCEDWRSRDQSWDDCRIALAAFERADLPLAKMSPSDHLVGNIDHDGSDDANAKYCLALPGDSYLVYLATVGETELDLSDADGEFEVLAFNPRVGGEWTPTGAIVRGGAKVTIAPPNSDGEDWALLVRRSGRSR